MVPHANISCSLHFSLCLGTNFVEVSKLFRFDFFATDREAFHFVALPFKEAFRVRHKRQTLAMLFEAFVSNYFYLGSLILALDFALGFSLTAGLRRERFVPGGEDLLREFNRQLFQLLNDELLLTWTEQRLLSRKSAGNDRRRLMMSRRTVLEGTYQKLRRRLRAREERRIVLE